MLRSKQPGFVTAATIAGGALATHPQRQPDLGTTIKVGHPDRSGSTPPMGSTASASARTSAVSDALNMAVVDDLAGRMSVNNISRSRINR